MSQTVLELEKLTIALPSGADRANAASDIDLVLRAGKVTCLIGESGSGKSLVARSVLGLLPRPHVRVGSGRILFEGQDLAVAPQDKMRAIRGAKIGMIFQEPMTALNPLHTIGRQLDEVLRIHTPLGKAARRARVLELIDSVHLPEPGRIIRSFPRQLSGGQRQRAMIAMALLLNPRLLIADEPTTALDVTTQAQILYLIRELQREHGTSVLFITHDFGVVADIADEVAVLQRGTLVERGTAAAALGAPRHASSARSANACKWCFRIPTLRSIRGSASSTLSRKAPSFTAPRPPKPARRRKRCSASSGSTPPPHSVFRMSSAAASASGSALPARSRCIQKCSSRRSRSRRSTCRCKRRCWLFSLISRRGCISACSS